MPESLLQILTFCLLLIVWLFLLRVIWAVWSEARSPLTLAPPPGGTTPAPSAKPAPAPAAANKAPAPGAPASLKIVEPAERKGQTFDLTTTDELKIGRAATNQVSLADDSYVSQLHARIFRRDGSLFVEDLGSTNGTFLNRKQLSGPVSLRRGDRIQVGRTVLEVGK